MTLAAKFKFGTEAHRKILEALNDRLQLSKDEYESRFDTIADMEKQYNAYVPVRAIDTARKTAKDSGGERDYVSIEIPYSYAVLMTAHTYYTSVFLARSPILQVSGRHGEGEQQTQAIEALLSYQLLTGGGVAPLFVWLLDPGRAGYGVLGHYWDMETINAREFVEEIPTFLGIPIPGAKPKKVPRVTSVPGYAGNRLYNVRPQDFFPDPRVSLLNFQRGEFCCRYVEIPWHQIVDGAKTEKYFNVEKLRVARDGEASDDSWRSTEAADLIESMTLPSSRNDLGQRMPSGVIKGYEMYVRLIPSEWGLGPESSREVWVFTFTRNSVLFAVEPLGMFHGSFPFDVLPCEPEAYSIFSASMMERIKPMHDAMSWLLNSHMFNVRASLNNQFVVDPSRVVMKDVESPNAGKIIRLKPAAYGQDIRTMLSQLQVGDVTRTHLNDMQALEAVIQRVIGVNDNVMGMISTSGRKTATEVRSSTSFSVNRLKTTCEWFSAVGFAPLTQKLIQSSQQFYDMERKFRIVGDAGMLAPQFATVTPESIAGFYDFEAVDGTLPVDRFAQANLWNMILGQARNFPQLMQGVDVVKLFGWIANLAGLKNFNQFRLQVVPDAQAAAQAQQGNVVPLRGGPPNLMEPGQVPGMGQTA